MYYPWWPQDGGGCTLRTSVKGLGALLVTCGAILVGRCWWESRGHARPRSQSPRGRSEAERTQRPLTPEPRRTGASEGPLAGVAVYPSGSWRGYYTHPVMDGGRNARQHGVCEFQLRFVPMGTYTLLRGEGADDVGSYAIEGEAGNATEALGAAAAGRMRFRKTYALGSRNAAGAVRAENKGHSVEYDCRPARTDANGHPVLANGVRGDWSIRHARGDFGGVFHLWPVMPREHWAQGEGARDGAPGGQAAADEESECVVCYDRRIDVRLEPCGHVALCGECASRLRPKRCPLCRADIQRIVADVVRSEES